jgi:ABC-type antimicrobial peptide transport system ATPase subunit
MVRHGEFQAKQMQDGADQALGLPQRQAEHRTKRQRRGNRYGTSRLHGHQPEHTAVADPMLQEPQGQRL